MNPNLIKYGTYAIFTYAAGHGCRDLYKGGRALYGKYKARQEAKPTEQPQPEAQQRAQA